MLGCDIVDINRIKKMIEKNGSHFLEKVFSKDEMEYADSSVPLRYQRYAVRFAAKEAIVKALRTGFRDITWKDVSVAKGELGEPIAVLSDKAQAYCETNNIKRIHISLSHTNDYAMATAMLELVS